MLCNPWCPHSGVSMESVLPPVIASSPSTNACWSVLSCLNTFTQGVCSRGWGMTALVLCTWRDNAISCATLPAFIMSFSGSQLLSLCFLAQQGVQPWTGPLAVAWQVILPNRICILAAAVLGMEAEYMEANCAYTDIAQAQPFRTPVNDRVAHKLSIWKELVLVAKKNVQGQSILQCLS